MRESDKMKSSMILATVLLACGAPAKAAEVWNCSASLMDGTEVSATNFLFHFELSPPDLIETKYAVFTAKEDYCRILQNDDYGVIATYANIVAPQPPKVGGGVNGFTIVIDKITGVFWYGGSALLNGMTDRPAWPQSISGKCQKG
jgi:hypothetical protein